MSAAGWDVNDEYKNTGRIDWRNTTPFDWAGFKGDFERARKDFDAIEGLDMRGKAISNRASNLGLTFRYVKALHGLFRLNERDGSVIVTRKLPDWVRTDVAPAGRALRDVDVVFMIEAIGKLTDAEFGVDTMTQRILLEASSSQYDPVREYLEGLKWDGVERTEKWLNKYLGCADTEWTQLIGEKWLISAVARTYKPACKADAMLVLEGAQGVGKSTALAILAGEWYGPDIPPLSSKDAQAYVHGPWVVDFGELDVYRRAEITTFKNFVTLTRDSYRPAYGRFTVTRERRCVFAATTNEDSYLLDGTGNRRFWPVHCTNIDTFALARDRDQLWAEAVHKFKSGEVWWLDDAESNTIAAKQQEERVTEDPLASRVIGKALHLTTLPEQQWTTIADIGEALEIKNENLNRAMTMRFAAVLRSAGWSKTRRRVNGTLVWAWNRPAGV